MTIAYVPFTNNAAENSIRMTKVQQKISGCFRLLSQSASLPIITRIDDFAGKKEAYIKEKMEEAGF